VSINQFIRHNFKANYEKILKVPEQISKENLLPHQRRKPVLADIEVMAINLTVEYVGIDSERVLFRKLPEDLCCCIERSVYNRRLSSCTRAIITSF
jgi:hypothetical protein